MFKPQMTKFVDVLMEREIIKSEDKEIIVHGLALGIELVFNIITTIILGFIFDLVIESLIFLVSFSYIRVYAGGYHCKKAINCYALSSGVVVLVLSIVRFTPKKYMFFISILMLLISLPIILKFAPVEIEAKPLDKVEQKYFRKILIRNLIIECSIIFILFITNLCPFAFVICIGIFVIAGATLLQIQLWIGYTNLDRKYSDMIK